MEEAVAFGRYQLIRRIAQGGMAEIYLAKLVGAAGVEKTLALKRIHTKYTEEARFLELFINEGRISSSLSHSNIVAVYDFGRVGDEYYLAMEYVPGSDIGALLRELKSSGKYLPWGLVLYIGAQVLTGLSYLHRRHKVTHGDITPRNLLLSQEGEVKLADFGVARVGLAFEGKLRGTIPYMSPEQANREAADPRSDLFSVALVLAEMLQGSPVYSAEDNTALLERVRRAEIGTISPKDRSTPTGLLSLLYRALSPDKSARFASAEEMHAALDAFSPQARESKSPCTALGLSLFLQDHLPERSYSKSGLQGSDKPAQSFVETHTNLSDIRTQTGDIPAPNKIFSPETPLATQLIALDNNTETPQTKRRHLWAAGAVVAGLSGFLLILQTASQPSPEPPSISAQAPLSVSAQESSAPASLAAPTPSSASAPSEDTSSSVPTSAPTPSSAPALEPNKKSEVKAKKLGYLTIDVLPWAEISIDGKLKGETPLFRIALPAGQHTIKAHHPILNITKAYSITITEGAEINKTFTLQK